MLLTAASFIPIVPNQQLFVWVLSPFFQSGDANIDYYYDFTQSIAEYKKTFEALGIDWKWQPVAMNDYNIVIDDIIKEEKKDDRTHIIFNLCDGDEVNGAPGISIVRMLQDKGLLYTGADPYFYEITTSKIPMKKAFDKAAVSNARWAAIQRVSDPLGHLFQQLGSPVIIKPSVSGGSMGIGIKNVVHNGDELAQQVQKMFAGYRGWNLDADGLIAESFINGPEYTVLIVGDYDHPEKATVYEPVERVFHASLPDEEKFLSFDRLWEIYEEETAMPANANFYEYAPADPTLAEQIKQLSWDAYAATRGKGYTRVDLRMDKSTGTLYVLEVNAQCGISDDEDFTSIGAILRLNGTSFAQLLLSILNNALLRDPARWQNAKPLAATLTIN